MRTLGPAEVLSETEVMRLIAQMSSPCRTQTRNRALVVILWRSGLRISEALDLRHRDISLDSEPPTLRVLDSKTSSGRRVVGLHRDAVDSMRAWLAKAPESEYVFCSLKGYKLDSGYVRRVLAREGKRAGIRRCHPHAFRATLAVELVKEGVSLPAVRDVLGHSNLANTDAYLRRVFPEMAISALVDRHTSDRLAQKS